jgi:branched-subunit amino acid transport protein
MTIWYAVLIVGVVSYACRLVPWLVLDRVELAPSVEAGLRYAGAGAITALLVGSLLHPQAAGGSMLPLLLALLVSGLLLWRGCQELLAIAIGMGVFFVIDLAW